ncbi:unnamed protein product [Phytophthora fragariaefolia]|uniref:Unnamed protein product n=1 Tax=Phytophthora fragariaefolia TaxID=1490495 RepID=A0A9W7D4R8_9STRA|nr:unnamed protein product [Phytophthora fragariaefolia]
MLDTSCELKLGVAAADVAEGMLTAEIGQIVSSIKNGILPDIKSLFMKKVKSNFSDSDDEARVVNYFNCFKKIMRENGLVDCFDGTDGSKEKCKRLIACIQPEALKAEVKQSVRFTHKPAAADPRLVFALIVKKAKEHERQFQRLKKSNANRGDDSKRTKGGTGKTAVGRNHVGTDKKRNYEGKPPHTGVRQLRATDKPSQSSASSARGPPSPSPKCK